MQPGSMRKNTAAGKESAANKVSEYFLSHRP